MIRTSVLLPASLHQGLLITAKQEKKSVSQLLRELADNFLTTRKEAQVERMYRVLKELDGIGEPGINDASTTIDEVLYGEHGAWRGCEK